MSRLGEPLNTADLEEMISDADKDHTGKINYRGNVCDKSH